jgi:hypothetical protein
MALPLQGINAYTHNFIEPKLRDTVYFESPVFVRLSTKRRDQFRGGLLVQQPLIVGKLAGGAVGPGEGAPPDVRVTETALQTPMKLYLVNVPLIGFNAMSNDGPEAVFKEINAKFANATAAMAEMLATDMYLSTAGGRTRNLVGFEEWIDDGNTYTTIGGITRTDIAPAGTVKGMNAYVASLTTFSLSALNRAITQTWNGNRRVDMIVCSRNGWDLIWNSLQPMQQNLDRESDVAQAGFQTVRVNGAEAVLDPYCPTGTSGRMWGINSQAVEWYFSVNPLFNFGFTGFKGTQLGIDTAGQFLCGNTLTVPLARLCFKLTSSTLF